MRTPTGRRRRSIPGVAIAAVSAGALVALGALATAVLTVAVARKVITPPKEREQDLRILAVDADTVTLSATKDTLTPGQYSLWFSRDTGHARIGEILYFDSRIVVRRLLSVDFGDLTHARAGRLSGWFYLGPAELDLPWLDVVVDTELGPAPAWLVPAPAEFAAEEKWVIQVHGRAVRREETLRSVPVFHRAGYTALLVSYRNDGDAPRSLDYRYALGDTEWRDVDAALRFALDRGAREVILMGWSMGGATVLQTLTRSDLADRIRAVVLDSPVIDWITALQYQGTENRLPTPVSSGALLLLSRGWAGFLTGQKAPVDLARLNIVANAAELSVPILLLHSADDGFVPVTASDALARERPDIVTYERFHTARHTKLWNYDRTRWEDAITAWLEAIESATERTDN